MQAAGAVTNPVPIMDPLRSAHLDAAPVCLTRIQYAVHDFGGYVLRMVD